MKRIRINIKHYISSRKRNDNMKVSSHLSINKSLAILICILVVGSIVEVGAFYYFQNFAPNFTSTSSALPSFQVANLTINPYQASVGQSVVISVAVVNVGDAQGSYSTNFKINDSVVNTEKLSLSVNESQIITYNVTEKTEGIYNVTVGDLAGIFSVTSKPTQMPAALKASNLLIKQSEIWPGVGNNITFVLRNTGLENVSYSVPYYINGIYNQSVPVQIESGASTTVKITVAENDLGNYQFTSAGLSGSFEVVPTGEYTLHMVSNHVIPFTLDGVSHTTDYIALVTAGKHVIAIQADVNIRYSSWGLVDFKFSGWNDGSMTLTKTFDVEGKTFAIPFYIHQGSCPSLFAWNGTGYNYVADVSDGAGWLGYLEYFNPDGTMTFSFNYPFDYIKLDSTQLQPKNGAYSFNMAEMADEIFYLDSAKILAVDHPANTNVFSTTSTFLYNLTNQGAIYTVSKNPSLPVSAVNGQGQNVLPLISQMDGNYTPATIWTWNHLTLNLGNLTGAKEINLVVGGKITWPSTQAGGSNFMKYASQPGVMPSPPPYMEVKAANGSWVKVPDNREFPLPDVTDNEFIVNLTGLFPTNDYELRINTYQDIQFDYIGVDTTPQQNIVVQTILPSKAELQQGFATDSNSSGAFTRYGDVTALLQSADNQFVIGRQGDSVSLQFSADSAPIPKGWVRDYFVVASCWFKGNGLPYVPLTVDPLPFQAMTSFPYPSNETYPYNSQNNAYLQKYNNRIIGLP